MFWVLIAIAVPVLSYWLLIRPHSYWARKGVVQGKPAFILGDMSSFILRKRSAPEVTQDQYNISPVSRYNGIYQFLKPVLLIKDPELIKQITVKDFDHFLDHNSFVGPDTDPLLGNTLVALTGERWREMRSTLRPAFTSRKMKIMFSLMTAIGEQFVKHFIQKNEKVTTIEMRDVASRFANDIIASTVFGFECDSLKNPNNEFYVMGKEATDFTSIRKIIVFFGIIFVPRLFKFFKLTLFSDKMNTYFTRLLQENIESREKHGIVRPDMISLLLEAKNNDMKNDESSILSDTGFAAVQESEIGRNQKSRKNKITNKDITAQAFTFFIAGFDSVSSLLCFMAYELAVNPDIQEKLREEVDDTSERCEGKITYEAITTMKYMDMVVSETLRKWPNAVGTDRICTKPYTIEPKTPDEKPVHLEKNDVIFIPTYAIHRDPKHYPDPERFDPERFNDQNKGKISPYTYMPFGTGPRNCIGSRFALLETKILFYYILSNFEIIPVEKTQIPIKLSKKAMGMRAENGYWLGLQRRIQ